MLDDVRASVRPLVSARPLAAELLIDPFQFGHVLVPIKHEGTKVIVTPLPRGAIHPPVRLFKVAPRYRSITDYDSCQERPAIHNTARTAKQDRFRTVVEDRLRTPEKMIFGGSYLRNGKAVIGTCNLRTAFLECERPFYFANQVDQVITIDEDMECLIVPILLHRRAKLKTNNIHASTVRIPSNPNAHAWLGGAHFV